MGKIDKNKNNIIVTFVKANKTFYYTFIKLRPNFQIHCTRLWDKVYP